MTAARLAQHNGYIFRAPNDTIAVKYDMSATGPLLLTEELRDLAKCAALWRKAGLKPSTAANYCKTIRYLLRKSEITGYDQLSREIVLRLIGKHARELGQDQRCMQKKCMSAYYAFAWALKTLGLSAPTIAGVTPPKIEKEPAIAAFLRHGRQQGWAEQTLLIRLRWLRLFRTFQSQHRGRWPVPRLREVDRFLIDCLKGRARATIMQAADSIRAWLRFLHIVGTSEHDLASAVLGPVQRRFAQPPRTVAWSTVRRLARGIDRATPRGRADYALYLLLCTYGLGVSEVVDLKLEDIDWRAKILHIHRRKTGVAIDLPLLPGVAKILASYIRRDRPPTQHPHVFLSQHIPYNPLRSGAAVTTRVVRWARRAKIKGPPFSGRLIRCSHATRQLERGVHLKIIGDILGHHDSSTTSRYVRSALNRLRRIALPVPR
jgi:integrase/recombinase XerD